MLGARREPARLFVVVTCRPGEITRSDGLARVIGELTTRKRAVALNLVAWSTAAVSDYLARRFPGARFPEDLARTIQHMTGGDPLFAAAIVDDLEDRRMVRPSEGGWELAAKEALAAARRSLDLGRDGGSPVWQGRAMSIHHWAATAIDPRTAQSHADELSAALALQLGAGPGGRTAFAPFVAEVYAVAGDAERALRELDDALAFVERTDERAWSSELHRSRGELLKDSEKAETERAFERALEIAREQGAKSFELRATLSLAKLDRGARTDRAALEELRRVYGSFTEGFEAGDLVEAKALLDAGR